MLSEAGYYTQNAKASVPWGQIAECTTDWLGVDHWPRDVNFKDPSKLQLSEAEKVFNHWTERERNGEVVVKFKKAGTGHMMSRGKKILTVTERGVNEDDQDDESEPGIQDSDVGSDVESDTSLPTAGPSRLKGKKKGKRGFFGAAPSSVLDNGLRQKFLGHMSTKSEYKELLECLATLTVSHPWSSSFLPSNTSTVIDSKVCP